jgi:two-component system, NarL family, invasion response regulator UvrY
MAERLNAPVLKTGKVSKPSRVRIPVPPPIFIHLITWEYVVINVLLVDDHDLVRAGIRRIIDDVPGIKVIAEARTGEEALRLGRQLKPHVVLMDVKMPGIGGFEATRKLLRVDPDVKVLIVTTCTNEVYPAKLLQVGASGYLTKGSSMNEMIQAIRAVHSGQRYISPEIASRLAFKHVSDDDGSPFDSLSERELQVLLMITNGMRVQDIADQLCLSPKTVNSYRYRIFEKLNVRNDVELTLLSIRYGLKDGEESDHSS